MRCEICGGYSAYSDGATYIIMCDSCRNSRSGKRVEYRPKGGMCFVCKNSYSNCSKLPFSGMRILSEDKDGMKVVKCTSFERI